MSRLSVETGPDDSTYEDCRLFPALVVRDELSLKIQAWTHLRTFSEAGATPRQFAQYLLKNGWARGDAQACALRVQDLLERMTNLPGYERTEALSAGRYRAVDLRDASLRERGGGRRVRAPRGETRVQTWEPPAVEPEPAPPPMEAAREETVVEARAGGHAPPEVTPLRPPAAAAGRPADGASVFIAGTKHRNILAQLTEILTFGRFIPVTAASTPGLGSLMEDMRSCVAAILDVPAEPTENALIEIGAALALYGRNVILLVERGVRLPSHLQGFQECRYDGDRLDGESTMGLLKAFNDLGAL